MTAPRTEPPRPFRRILRRLLPGARGEEVVGELDREYETLRDRYSGLVAGGWYLAQILRPATWRLAGVLWRIRKAERAAGSDRFSRVRHSGVPWGLSLDVKLAVRMLVKSPGLTVVGVLGIALGVALGVAAFVIISSTFYPELPLDDGERIVALQHWDVVAGEAVPSSLLDFVTWRDELRSVERISAASMGTRILHTGEAHPRIVRAAAMTATAFDVARIPPLLGRDLDPADERPEAPRVALLGYDLWRTSFGGQPGVIGRTILLEEDVHTVVGVMPPGFAFPRNEEIWTSLQVGPAEHERDAGPGVFVFGRLAPGVTPERAQAEVTALGRRTAAAAPEARARLRPEVLPYTLALDGPRQVTLWEVAQVQSMVLLILVAIAANVAVLVYARTALRQGEIAVRTALGASRRRVVAQLFLEALALSVVGAALGLGAAHFVVERVAGFLEGMDGIAFWIEYGLQPRSVAYALALALIIAVIVGVVPGLKSTGRSLDAHLRRLGAGTSVRLGGMWTAMIVAQVAVAVTILPTVLEVGVRELTMVGTRATYPVHDFLSAQVAPVVSIRPGMDAERYRSESTALFRERLPELERRLEAQVGVVGVTLESPSRGPLVEVEGVPGPMEGGAHRTGSVGVAPDYFELLGLRMLAGRALDGSDRGPSGGGVVVSEGFVRWVLDGGTAVGRRVRFVPGRQAERLVESPPPWLEIVGVVRNPQESVLDAEWAPPIIFHAVSPEGLESARLLVRVRNGDVDGFAPTFRRIVAETGPELRLGAVGRLSAMGSAPLFAVMTAALTVVLASVVLLSAAGVHALTSVAVTRRRKEIGIRRALGSPGRDLLGHVYSRAAWQLGLGGIAGSLFGGALLVGSGRTGRELAAFLGAVVLLMLGAGLVAAVGPTVRALRIQPAEALQEE